MVMVGLADPRGTSREKKQLKRVTASTTSRTIELLKLPISTSTTNDSINGYFPLVGPYTMPSATPPAPLHSSTSPLPPPSTFDILPPLHNILLRLLLPPPQLPSGVVPTTIPGLDSLLSSPDYLAPKSLGTATSEVKNKIKKARVAVQGLPDVDRAIEEQEVEIEELEREVERLKGVIKGIAESAGEACEEGKR